MFLSHFQRLRPYKKAALIAILLVLFAVIFRKSSWGINHLFVLDSPIIMTLLALAGVLVYLGYARSGRKHTKDDLEPEKTIATWQLLVLPLVVALMSLAFPMITDAYGDARSIIANYEEIYAKDKGLLKAFLTLIDLDIFNLHNGERFTFNAVYILRKVFNLDLKEGFQIFGAIIGVGTAIVFSIYLKISRLGFGLPYILFFLSLNSMLMFSGHIEVYGPSILLVALFALIGKIQYERNGRSTLWWLLIEIGRAHV